jgi:hypothetical protein
MAKDCKKPCQHCGSYEHFTYKCDKVEARPIGQAHFTQAEPGDQPAGNAFMINSSPEDQWQGNTIKSQWMLDSGADFHMTPFKDQLFDYREDKGQVRVGNNALIVRLGVGSLRAHTRVGNQVKKIIVKDVWYVPDLVRGLLSQNTLILKGFVPSVNRDTLDMTFHDASFKPFLTCVLRNKVYWPMWMMELNPEFMPDSVKQSGNWLDISPPAQQPVAMRMPHGQLKLTPCNQHIYGIKGLGTLLMTSWHCW